MGQHSFSVAATEKAEITIILYNVGSRYRNSFVMENYCDGRKKKKRGRPKVDASLTETVYQESRHRYTNPEAVVPETGTALITYCFQYDSPPVFILGTRGELFISYLRTLHPPFSEILTVPKVGAIFTFANFERKEGKSYSELP